MTTEERNRLRRLTKGQLIGEIDMLKVEAWKAGQESARRSKHFEDEIVARKALANDLVIENDALNTRLNLALKSRDLVEDKLKAERKLNRTMTKTIRTQSDQIRGMEDKLFQQADRIQFNEKILEARESDIRRTLEEKQDLEAKCKAAEDAKQFAAGQMKRQDREIHNLRVSMAHAMKDANSGKKLALAFGQAFNDGVPVDQKEMSKRMHHAFAAVFWDVYRDDLPEV